MKLDKNIDADPGVSPVPEGTPDCGGRCTAHDALTGLPGRAAFEERLAAAFERARRDGDSLFAVLSVNLDRFGNINHGLGYAMGDRMLAAVARRLEDCAAPGMICRVWGDEFAVLLEDIRDVADAISAADRLQAGLEAPFVLDGNEFFLTASLGIVVGPAGYDRAEDLLRDSDTAVQRAKCLGRSRHEVFDPAMRARAVHLLEMENELRRALERGEFEVEYQPVVALGGGLVEGFEALLRWRHPRRGLVPPEEFIPLAEEIGLIVPVGWFVLREACRQLRAWRTRHPAYRALTVGVNLSASQLLQPDLIQRVCLVLREAGLDAGGLRLEVTESVVARNPKLAVAAVEHLRALGVRLHIDDFGTGYASLGMLHDFPAEALKIDRSFIEEMSPDNESTGIVRTIVTLAHELGMKVVAEGVQTAGQLSLLREAGCDYGQGYLFSEPLAGAEAEALIWSAPRW